MIPDFQHEFTQYRQLSERAIAPLDDQSFFRKPADHMNSIALIVKHLAGNLRSRWTDFLTADGEKPNRNRDGEFNLLTNEDRPQLMAQWNSGWSALEKTLASLQPSDLQKKITIRGEQHSAQQALLRGINHAAYHTGQILYLSRMWKPDAPWLTIPPGGSSTHKPAYRKT